MEKLERFIIHPSIRLFGGVQVDKDTEFVTHNEDKTVKQTLKNMVLTTKISKTHGDQYKSTETSKMVQEIPEGTFLIWGEDTGYIIPNYRMARISEAIDSLIMLKGVEDDTSRNQEEGPGTGRGTE